MKRKAKQQKVDLIIVTEPQWDEREINDFFTNPEAYKGKHFVQVSKMVN